MGRRLMIQRIVLGRDVAIAFAVIASLYLIRGSAFQPLQLPAYFLIVAYDTLEIFLPVLTPYYPVAFPLFLYVLAILGAGIARAFQPDTGDDWAGREAMGGVAVIVGLIALLFGARIGGPLIAPVDNPTPLAITTTTGILLLLAGWWFLGHPRTISDLRR